MSEPIITLVNSENVAPMWPYVSKVLKDAIDMMDTHDPEDIYEALLMNNAHLWVQWNNGVDAAVITEFVPYPKGVWLRVWLGGSKRGAKIDWKEMDDHILRFAHGAKCNGAELIGREGWMKRYPKAKTQQLVMMRLPFAQGVN